MNSVSKQNAVLVEGVSVLTNFISSRSTSGWGTDLV